MFTSRFRGYFTKSNNQQSQGNDHQCKSYLCASQDLVNIHNSSRIFSALRVANKLTIAPAKLTVNETKLGLINIATNQKAVKLEQIAENTFKWDFLISKENFIKTTLAEG